MLALGVAGLLKRVKNITKTVAPGAPSPDRSLLAEPAEQQLVAALADRSIHLRDGQVEREEIAQPRAVEALT